VAQGILQVTLGIVRRGGTRGASRCCPRYNPAIEAQMRAFYQSLSEKDRRRYAAIEACKLGHGGHSYIARVLGCDRHTIAQGMQELTDPDALQHPHIRRSGGGRKPSDEVIPGLDTAFLQVLRELPMNMRDI
jgi:hypothetical protein